MRLTGGGARCGAAVKTADQRRSGSRDLATHQRRLVQGRWWPAPLILSQAGRRSLKLETHHSH